MGRKIKGQLFGVFDEQAISVLAALTQKDAKFSELLRDTKLSKASLFRVLARLGHAGIVRRTPHGYVRTRAGRELMGLVLRIAKSQERRTLAELDSRVRALERDLDSDHRIFHTDLRWERTLDKPLVEVMATYNMTGTESLLFQQRFQEEAALEEEKLRRSAKKA